MANVNPISLRYPFELRDQPPEIVQAHRYAFSGLVDLNQAIAALKAQLDAKTTTTITSASSSSGGGVIPVPTPFPFPGLGAVRDLTGSTAYTVLAADNGILLILSDSSPVTLTLDSAMTTPYFLFASNFGSANVTLSPTSGTINQPTLDVGGLYLIVFDGANWKASALLAPLPNFADDETPSGLINSSNVTFTLAHSPSPAASLELFLNGLVQNRGVDYTLSTNTITFTSAPVTGSTLLGWYRY